ncbi:ATP-binding cassette domain-containing protein [Kitasatospora sp. NPDC002040]|uniref:phosphonate ABC transporter ATP-binding protein n=1 Tax=Kitasatospora sp. NPDC002040 TaxID=3154661 RepID=UPI00332BD667
MLELSGITVRYGPKQVLHGIELTVPRGQFLAVLGANGCGKSTLLRAAAGLEPVAEGTVTVDGRAGDPLALAMVFQQTHLVHRRTVLDNVCAGALGRLPLRRSLTPRLFPPELREEAMACLDRVGLAGRAHDRAGRLSGGQQQRVAVARALCQRPDVLLADEPVSALDPAASEQVLALLAQLAHEEGLAVVAVLHQPSLAAQHADRVVGLREGRVVLDGPPGQNLDSLYQPADRTTRRPALAESPS